MSKALAKRLATQIGISYSLDSDTSKYPSIEQLQKFAEEYVRQKNEPKPIAKKYRVYFEQVNQQYIVVSAMNRIDAMDKARAVLKKEAGIPNVLHVEEANN